MSVVGAPYQAHSATSRAAAEAVLPRATTYRERVLDTIRLLGPVSDEAIERHTELGGSTVRPRRVELLRDGLIEPAGEGRTRSGRRCQLWAAVPVQQRLL